MKIYRSGFNYMGCICRLISEVEDVLGDRKEVTGDDLDKMKYTEQVLGHVTNMAPHTGHIFTVRWSKRY